MNWKHLLCSGAMLAAAQPGFGADIPKAPVPVSPFIRVVYAYADAMLKHGRDQTGLFFSALDRHTLAPLTNRPTAPEGVRPSDRVGANSAALTGSNPYHDENLLRLLSTLSDLSAKPHYRAAADAELKSFVEHHESSAPDAFRPWMLWDRCFELAPDASRRFAPGPAGSPRQAAFEIRRLAAAYAHTKDEQFVRAVVPWLVICQANRSPEFALTVAIDCDGAAHRMPASLASQLRAVATEQDRVFCSLPHEVKKHGGFQVGALANPGDATARHTPRWRAGFGDSTTAQMGMMCVSRYDNTGDVPYRDLIFAAADSYLDSLPGNEEDAWPATFGHAISLELAAWRHSANWKYMDRARTLGNVALEKFWGTNALPRASLKTDHYESITGADTLALGLLELHLQILHITAVRCPANTVDR